MTLRVTEAEAQEIIMEVRALGAPGISIILKQLLQTTQLPNFSAALPTTVRYMLLSEGLVIRDSFESAKLTDGEFNEP